MNTPTVPTMSTTVPEVLVAAVSELLACQAPILARLRATTDATTEATTVVPADTSNTTVVWTEGLVAAFCDAIASIVGSAAWETVRPMEAPSEVRFTNATNNATAGPSVAAPVAAGSPVTWGRNPGIVNGRLVLGEDVCVCLLRQRVGCPEEVARVAWRTIVPMLAEAPGALPGVSVRTDPNDPAALIATVVVS